VTGEGGHCEQYQRGGGGLREGACSSRGSRSKVREVEWGGGAKCGKGSGSKVRDQGDGGLEAR